MTVAIILDTAATIWRAHRFWPAVDKQRIKERDRRKRRWCVLPHWNFSVFEWPTSRARSRSFYDFPFLYGNKLTDLIKMSAYMEYARELPNWTGGFVLSACCMGLHGMQRSARYQQQLSTASHQTWLQCTL